MEKLSDLHVAGVQPGSAAANAGLVDGDLIVGLGDSVSPVTVEEVRVAVRSQSSISLHTVRNDHYVEPNDDTAAALDGGPCDAAAQRGA